MMYAAPPAEDPLAQGDLLDSCPIFGAVTYMRIGLPAPYETES